MQTRMVEMIIPDHANYYGTLFGGNGLALMAKAAFVAATRHAGTSVVMARSEQVDFTTPIRVGEILDLPGISYRPVFDYELVLAVPERHPIGAVAIPSDLAGEVLITYPVEPARLDIFTRFLVPGNCLPRRHRTVETTDMMLQLVAAGRGVSAVPDWLLREERAGLPIRAARIGKGLPKAIHLGIRRGEEGIDYIAGFLDLAAQAQPGAAE